MSHEKIRVGVIGTGIGTSIHIPGFKACADTQILAVCSTREERAKQVANKFGIPYIFTDYLKMLEFDELDAVSIATPPHLHYPMTMAALESGKHILCEKPMALNLEEAEKMYQKAENSNLVHMINHEFRFFPARVRMKELIDEGYLGQLYSIHSSTFYGPQNGSSYDGVTVARLWNWWSDKSQGGGLLGALGAHVIDAIRYWFGEVGGIYGQLETVAKSRKIEGSEEIKSVTSDDAFALIFRLKSGALGTVVASSAARLANDAPGMSSFEAYGSEGSLLLSSDGILRGGRRSDKEAKELVIPEKLELPRIRGHFLLPPFMMLLQEFVRGIKESKKVTPNFYDGMKHQEIINAIHLSHCEGRWVTLPL